MTEAARQARAAYKRQWNKNNRDKIKASVERYWERKAAATAGSGNAEPSQATENK